MKIMFSILLLSLCCSAGPALAGYVVAEAPTPLLNTPDWAGTFSGRYRLDPCKGVRPIETVLLPGTLLKVEGEEVRKGVKVYRVTTADYPYPSGKGYYVDTRFVKPVPEGTPERPRRLPSFEQVRQGLVASLGKPYVWGGNVRDGVPLLRKLYPHGDPLAGVDCSGLLYEATNGYTPRNTSTLTTFGERVPVAGLSAEEIAKKLEPLDLIVWKGHVMIVLDRKSIIESTMGCEGGERGVHLTPLKEGVRRLMQTKIAVDEYREIPAGKKGFVVRRWFPEGAAGDNNR